MLNDALAYHFVQTGTQYIVDSVARWEVHVLYDICTINKRGIWDSIVKGSSEESFPE
jgi:hypothetical protein